MKRYVVQVTYVTEGGVKVVPNIEHPYYDSYDAAIEGLFDNAEHAVECLAKSGPVPPVIKAHIYCHDAELGDFTECFAGTVSFDSVPSGGFAVYVDSSSLVYSLEFTSHDGDQESELFPTFDAAYRRLEQQIPQLEKDGDELTIRSGRIDFAGDFDYFHSNLEYCVRALETDDGLIIDRNHN